MDSRFKSVYEAIGEENYRNCSIPVAHSTRRLGLRSTTADPPPTNCGPIAQQVQDHVSGIPRYRGIQIKGLAREPSTSHTCSLHWSRWEVGAVPRTLRPPHRLVGGVFTRENVLSAGKRTYSERAHSGSPLYNTAFAILVITQNNSKSA